MRRNMQRAGSARRGRSNAPQMWRELPDGRVVLEGISPRRQALNRTLLGFLDAVAAWLRRHWLLLVTVFLGAFVGLAVLVPVFYALGWQGIARRIFLTYHTVCDQIPSHSYFLFDYQLALCSRNLAIYGSLLVGSLAFRAVRNWLRPLDWHLWLATMLPMALDGGTQFFGWRESTWELRTLTGVILGVGLCWFVLPTVEAAAHGDDSRARVEVDLGFLRHLLAGRQQRAGA